MSALGRQPQNNLSHVCGSTADPLWNVTIPQLLAQTAARLPDHPAAVFTRQAIRWTYRDFEREVDRLAAGLLTLGIEKGDRVGIWAPNCAEWLLTQFATARIGAILVCINPAYRLSELEYALNKVGCAALVMAPRHKSSDYVAMLTELMPELANATPGACQAARVPMLRHVIVTGDAPPAGTTGFDALCAAGSGVSVETLDQISNDLSPQDAINIQFTSGTTGSPKGACLTHHNIVNNAHFVTQTMQFTEADRLCIPVPFYHCFGMVMGTLGCVSKGATMVIPGEGFDARTTLEAVTREKCTALYGVPTMFVNALELADFDAFDLSSLRTGIMAGAPCPIEVMRQVQARMHMHGVTIAYGMTETSPVSFQSNVDDPLEKRVSSVGRIHPHVEVKIVDATGNTVKTGEQGELLTRGYSVMLGYWEDDAQTAASIDAQGWMHTGDLARLDADGFCTITGRLKDMILRGGENIYPREIEEFLYTHPDILQAQVFGIPDHKLGEAVCAWIVARAGSDLTETDVQDFCRSAIAHFKVPAYVSFKDELPMTVTGKPQKFVMRDRMVKELGRG
ncbi:AMP-binding protein [Roseobacter denitrificans]|uniref:3-methylmercaptopropionyl-CoA ligase n=1 Tax=Roseobacter denitrificans (strain ATCC 33942 / OCh 114) TaxID=375451 RepID=Q16B81_ROSDO|nr:AMP-binding protein [Roseobacter denitrificans]ABG30762.1 putative long chain fatty acid acyl-CoA ligase [Roseobacter denitrificans OCh 114]AVL54984.1 AMP-binding protein [Roseobacter denitrificans]SFG17276.1 fatty-acyl-CoA synthase [Roseobacter denitrificans OCh 114]